MQSIKLIGIKNNRYKKMKEDLLEVLSEMDMNIPIEEVYKVDDILKYELAAIPSILINDEVVLQQNNHVILPKEIKKAIETYFQPFYEVKNILVPVDFSDTSIAAFQYAQYLASLLDASLTVVHVHHIPSNAVDEYLAGTDIYDQLLKDKKDLLDTYVNLNLLKEGDRYFPIKEIKTIVKEGDPITELLKLSASTKYSMIAMGTFGAGNFTKLLFGSVASDVSRNAACPVLLVPKQIEFKGIKNVLYAGDHESANSKMLSDIALWAKKFDAHIHLVHINDDAKNSKKKKETFELEQLFDKKAAHLDLRMITVEADTVHSGIIDYSQQHQIDLVVLVTHQRSFWEKIMHRSVVQQMIKNTQVPLMVLHTNG